MTSSVTVDKNLRKRIKKIAAELDTTQGDVIEKAVDAFEKSLQKDASTQNQRARDIMKKAANKCKNDKTRQKVRAALSEPGIDIDEIRIEGWVEINEN
ncbi:MAG: hypothetical protein ACW99A_12720 [Candidatus Kariarchaeaceae archaeon]|jgi:Skp family chaperone for outer membrane proteins